MKNNIKAEIVAHSKRAGSGEEILTYKLTFPRIILSELNTYKMIEKNTASHRAVKFEKLVEVVNSEPFIPLAFGKHHTGMQNKEYFTDEEEIKELERLWLVARDRAVESATDLYNKGASKQLANRIIESYTWCTQLCTGTCESFEHLFHQRCPIYEVPYYITDPLEDDKKIQRTLGGCSKKDIINHIKENNLDTDVLSWDDIEWLKHNRGQAEIHFMDLAEKMYDALNESEPVIMKEDEWHIPFSDRPEFTPEMSLKDRIMLSCAMTARVSFTTIADNEILTLEKAKRIYDKCVEQGHFSVVSHCAKCMTDNEYESWIKGKVTQVCFSEFDDEFFLEAKSNKEKGWNKNIKGFLSLRQYVEDGVELSKLK